MTPSSILQHRLANQQISRHDFPTSTEIVEWLGAVQSQDYGMAKWAIGLRLPGATNAIIEKALDKGDIIRTHILRPTWHFVAARDIHWMMQLTAPHIKKLLAGMQRKMELDGKLFKKIFRLIARSLSDNTYLTRQELMAGLAKAGITADPIRAAHILVGAELEGLICNGPVKDRKFTYALLDERVVAPTKKITRKEALTKLATKYFSSHGPATLHDFAWWSGLNVTEIRSVLDFMEASFLSEDVEGQTYWFREPQVAAQKQSGIQLLPSFDEFMVGYKDRSASLASRYTKQTITANGIFRPIIVVNGKTEGLWRALKTKEGIQVELTLFKSSQKLNKKLLEQELKKYEAFLGTKIKKL